MAEKLKEKSRQKKQRGEGEIRVAKHYPNTPIVGDGGDDFAYNFTYHPNHTVETNTTFEKTMFDTQEDTDHTGSPE